MANEAPFIGGEHRTIATMPANDALFGAASARMPGVLIDRASLQANWRMLAALHPGGRTGAAVKADGYGLGAVTVADALYQAGCRDFFVAWPQEGVALREAMRRFKHAQADPPAIYVLQGLEPQAVDACLGHALVPVLSNPGDLAVWQDGLRRLRRRAPAALQFETGMNRLGFERIMAETLAAERAGGRLDPVLVMSHLASADEPGGQTGAQAAVFREILRHFPGVAASLANSAGALLGPDLRFDLTRPGIALYGGRAGPQSEGCLKPVATLTAAVLQVRRAPAGEAAGYGGAARLSRDSGIATIGIGYADGYLRALSGAGVVHRQTSPAPEAFVAGRRVPVLGRVSMDLTLLDVTDLPEDAVAPGTRVELFGPNMPIDRVAEAAGTIAYELLTGLGPRVSRDWV